MLQQGDERRAPDEITFNSIINVLSKHEQVEKAQHVFDMIHMVRTRHNLCLALAGMAGSDLGQLRMKLCRLILLL